MKRIVLFGCGKLGELGYSKLSKSYDIIGFSDNNSSLWGQKMRNIFEQEIEIMPPSKISIKTGSDVTVIICVQKHYEDIARQMKALNLNYAIFLPEIGIVGFDLENGISIADLYRSVTVMPENLQVELSSVCQLSCKYCPYHGDTGGKKRSIQKAFMDNNTIKHIANQAKELKSFKLLTLAGHGETLLNKSWFEMASYLLEQTAIEDVVLFTNGMDLSIENVDKLNNLPCKKLLLITSIDGISPQDMQYWRKGASYNVIKENLTYALQTLNKCKAVIQVHNICVLPEGYKPDSEHLEAYRYFDQNSNFLYKDFPGAVVSVGPVCNFVGNHVDGTKSINLHHLTSHRKCLHRFETIYISSGGEIKSCPCDSNEFFLGNVNKVNMHDVWFNDKRMNRIRESFKVGKPMCNCPNAPGVKQSVLVRSS